MTDDNVPFFLKITVDDTIALKCPRCFTITMNNNVNREGRNCNHDLMVKKVFLEIASSVTSVKDILEDLKRTCRVQGPLEMYIDDHLVLTPSTRVNIPRLQDMNIRICRNPDCVVLEGVTADIDVNVDAQANVDIDADHGNKDPNLNLTAKSLPRKPQLSTPLHGYDGNEDVSYGSLHETEAFAEFSKSIVGDDEVENEDEINVEDSLNSQESATRTLSFIPEAEQTDVEENHNDEVLDPESVEVTLNELQISESSEQKSVSLESPDDVYLDFDQIPTYTRINEEAQEKNSIVSNEKAGSSASASTSTSAPNSGSDSSIKLDPVQSHRQTNDNGDFVRGRKRKFSSIASDDGTTTRSFSLTPLSSPSSSSSSGTSYTPKTMKIDSENASSQVDNMTGKRVIAVDRLIWKGKIRKISDEYKGDDTSQWSTTSETSVSSPSPSGSPVYTNGTPTPKAGILLKSLLPYRRFARTKIETENQGKRWHPISSLSEEIPEEGSYIRFKFVVKERCGGKGAEDFDIVLFVKELSEVGVTGCVIHENDAMVKYENERFFYKDSIQDVFIWK